MWRNCHTSVICGNLPENQKETLSAAKPSHPWCNSIGQVITCKHAWALLLLHVFILMFFWPSLICICCTHFHQRISDGLLLWSLQSLFDVRNLFHFLSPYIMQNLQCSTCHTLMYMCIRSQIYLVNPFAYIYMQNTGLIITNVRFISCGFWWFERLWNA